MTVSGLCKIEKQAPGILSIVNIYYDFYLEDRQEQFQRACISESITLLKKFLIHCICYTTVSVLRPFYSLTLLTKQLCENVGIKCINVVYKTNNRTVE